MRKNVFAALIVATSLVSAVSAQAQERYYMRERILAIRPSSTFAPAPVETPSSDPVTTPTPTPTPTPDPTPEPTPTVTYSWATGAWSGGCSVNAYQTRSVTCVKSTGGTAPPTQCSSAGARPAVTKNQTDYSTCTYSLHDHGVGACTNGTRPHYYDCMRSDGTDGTFVGVCRPGWNNPVMEAC